MRRYYPTPVALSDEDEARLEAASADYDALAAKLAQTGGLEARAEIVKQMNDLIIQGGGMIAITHRALFDFIIALLLLVKTESLPPVMVSVSAWQRTVPTT